MAHQGSHSSSSEEHEKKEKEKEKEREREEESSNSKKGGGGGGGHSHGGGGEEDDDDEECGFCLFMKGGPCRDSFVRWEKCMEEAESKQEDIVSKCFEVTSILKTCMESHTDYYEPVLRAEREMDAAEKESSPGTEKEAAPGGTAKESSKPTQEPSGTAKESAGTAQISSGTASEASGSSRKSGGKSL